MSPNEHGSNPSSSLKLRANRRLLLAGAAAAVVGIATSDPGARPVQAGSATPAPSASPTALDESAALGALAAAGIAVFEHALDAAPMLAVPSPGPIALLGFQFRALLFEANHGGGVLGADLDQLTLDPAFWPWAGKPIAPNPFAKTATPEPTALPIPPSALVAAYGQAADSPGAALTRVLLPGVDVASADEAVFPTLVLLLFAAEIARDEAGSAAAWAPRGASGARALLPQAGACSAVQGFVDQVLNTLFGALHVNLGSSVPGKILSSVINFLLTAAQRAVKEALNALTAPVLSVVKTIAGVVGTVGIIISAIRPWTVLLKPNPAATRFSIGSEATITGRVDCTVDLGGFDEWPPDIADCAAAAGVPLPDLKPAGAPCHWSLVNLNQPVIVSDAEPAKLDGDGHAALTYHTLSEDDETAKGNPVQGLVKVTASVERPAIADLQRTLSNVVFAQLPAIVATFVRPILGPPIDNLLSRLAALTESQASAIVSVTFHTPKEKTPTPAPTKPAGQAGAITTAFTSPPDAPFPVTISLKAESCDGIEWNGTMRLEAHIDGGVAKLDLDGTAKCAWSFAKGTTAKTNVGPFKSQVITATGAPQPYAAVLHMTAVKSKGKKGGSLGAIAFSFTATVSVAGDTVTSPLTGATNTNTPIAITPGASAC